MLLTPDGRVAQYYYGARYFPTDLRFGLIQASQNQIGTLADQIVLYCYHYDPRVGRYGVIVSRVIQLSGGITLLIFGSFLIFLFKNEPNRRWRTRKSALDREVTNPVSAGHATGAAISRQGD
jgi:protein SCO1/2